MDRNPNLMMELSVIQSVVRNRLNIDSSVLEAQIVLDYIGQVWILFFATSIPLQSYHREIRIETVCFLYINRDPVKPFSIDMDVLKVIPQRIFLQESSTPEKYP